MSCIRSKSRQAPTQPTDELRRLQAENELLILQNQALQMEVQALRVMWLTQHNQARMADMLSCA